MGMAHNNLLGGAVSTASNLVNNSISQTHPYGQQGMAGAMNAYNGQLAMQQAYAAQQQAALTKMILPHKWVWNGKPCTIEEFANQAFGDDTPEKTMFLLRYADKDNT